MNIQDLRVGISQIKQAGMTPSLAVSHLTQVLHQFVAQANLSPLQKSLASQGRYRRQRLSLPQDDFHIVMALWMPHCGSPIHDHDEAIGAVVTLVGTTIETKYDRVATLGRYDFLTVGQPQVLEPAAVSPILPGHGGLQLHAMHNPNPTWAATLHVYLHPLTTFNVYQPQACDLYTRMPEPLWFDHGPAPYEASRKPSALTLARSGSGIK